MSQQKKARKVGRPKLPNGLAKGRIVPIRFNAQDLKVIAAVAKSKNQTVSGWIRTTLIATIRAIEMPKVPIRYKGEN